MPTGGQPPRRQRYAQVCEKSKRADHGVNRMSGMRMQCPAGKVVTFAGCVGCKTKCPFSIATEVWVPAWRACALRACAGREGPGAVQLPMRAWSRKAAGCKSICSAAVTCTKGHVIEVWRGLHVCQGSVCKERLCHSQGAMRPLKPHGSGPSRPDRH